jgi:hypothetical protein
MELSGRSTNSTLRFEKNLKSALNFVCKARRRHPVDMNAVLSQQTGLGAVVDYESVGGKAVRENIDAVLLLEEYAGDQKMQALLSEVLTEQFANGESIDFLRTEDISSDPKFVGSRAAVWNEGKMEREFLLQRQ